MEIGRIKIVPNVLLDYNIQPYHYNSVYTNNNKNASDIVKHCLCHRFLVKI